ncbi:ANR family transcriptional regulator [Escherichia coli]|nr:ANR family transcriptional regulator [Escherichia coli]
MSSYHYYSEFAARAERARQYAYAAMLWSKAACLADNYRNAEWAAWRKDFCVARSIFHHEIVWEGVTVSPDNIG